MFLHNEKFILFWKDLSDSNAKAFEWGKKFTNLILSVNFHCIRDSEFKKGFCSLQFLMKDCLSAENEVYFSKRNYVDQFIESEN